MPNKLRKKKLDAIIPVDKNKLKSERLFGKIYLKLFCNISSNFIWKCLLCNIISGKVSVKRPLCLDNIITYNLHMTFNCLNQCKVTRPWLNKVLFPDQIIMLLCLIFFFFFLWSCLIYRLKLFCVVMFFCLQCFCFVILQHCRTSGNRSLKD